MKIIISGSTGFIGNNLSNYLADKGHNIIRLVRKTSKNISRNFETHLWDPDNHYLPDKPFIGSDAVIHLGGRKIISLRWTEKIKKEICYSRVNSTEILTKFISKMEKPPSKLIVASAGGFYGNTLDQKVDESDNVGTGFLAKTAEEWENSTFKFKLNKTSVIHTRFGLVLDKKEGAFPLISMPFKYGLGSYIGTGENWISWVSLLDTIKIYEYILNNEIDGPINVVNEKPLRTKDFCEILSQQYNKKILFRIPPYLVKILAGEMGNEMILSSSKIYPKKLKEAGYKFEFNELPDLLKSFA